MHTQADDLAPAGLTIDRERHALRFERDLPAPPGDVFEAWTDPRRVAIWWDPAGEPLAECTIDLRVGGDFSFTNRSMPGHPFAGTYREISPPDRLVFEALGSIGRVLLSEAGPGTRMVVEIECASAEAFDGFIQMGVHAGTGRTLDNLVAYMSSVKA